MKGVREAKKGGQLEGAYAVPGEEGVTLISVSPLGSSRPAPTQLIREEGFICRSKHGISRARRRRLRVGLSVKPARLGKPDHYRRS